MQTGQIIAKLRMQAGLSQTQLADALFVSRDLVSKWETGKRHPDRKMLEAMAKIFGVGAEHLIDMDVHLSEELSTAFPAGYSADVDTLKRDLNAFLGTLNIKENNVRVILTRTRKKLKKYLKGAANEQ